MNRTQIELEKKNYPYFHFFLQQGEADFDQKLKEFFDLEVPDGFTKCLHIYKDHISEVLPPQKTKKGMH
jgi:hypothetical protein